MGHDLQDSDNGSGKGAAAWEEIKHVAKRLGFVGILIVIVLFFAHLIANRDNISTVSPSAERTNLANVTASDDGICGEQLHLSFVNHSKETISYIKYQIVIADEDRSGVSETFSGSTNKILRKGDNYSDCTDFQGNEYLTLISRRNMDKPVITAMVTDVVIANKAM